MRDLTLIKNSIVGIFNFFQENYDHYAKINASIQQFLKIVKCFSFEHHVALNYILQFLARLQFCYYKSSLFDLWRSLGGTFPVQSGSSIELPCLPTTFSFISMYLGIYTGITCTPCWTRPLMAQNVSSTIECSWSTDHVTRSRQTTQ